MMRNLQEYLANAGTGCLPRHCNIGIILRKWEGEGAGEGGAAQRQEAKPCLMLVLLKALALEVRIHPRLVGCFMPLQVLTW